MSSLFNTFGDCSEKECDDDEWSRKGKISGFFAALRISICWDHPPISFLPKGGFL